MKKYASKVVEQAIAWLGKKESDGSHREIIDVYNSQPKLPRYYPVKYTDAWCSTFVSAVAVKLGYTDIIPTECGCEKHTRLFKEKGIWVEDDGYVPSPGDIIFYNWDDNGVGDTKGYADHVGIVEKVENGKITVIEGNYSNSVKRRYMDVNGRYIRGYGVPKYDKEGDAQEITVLDFQKAAILDGFSFPLYDADGIWGEETEGVTKNAVVKRRVDFWYPNLTKLVQKIVGADIDGKCGPDTEKAIKNWQIANNLTPDGKFGPDCWKKVLA